METLESREVLIVPGLWVPGVAMRPFALGLARRGYVPHIFSYSGRAALGKSVDALAAVAKDRRLHFLGHSLGGLLVLEALNLHAEVAAASAVLMAAPVRGCLAGRRLARSAAGRWMLGASLPLWEAGRPARWTGTAPLGVIAGTRSIGLGRLLGTYDEPNDGVVQLSETVVDGARDQVQLSCAHSEMALSGRAISLAASFFATGRFAQGAQ